MCCDLLSIGECLRCDIYVSYVLHFRRPNEALLSINCFQKDLGDTNPLVRAWALRTMAGIRLHAIAPLALVAVRKGARDPSVYVRKCAANALPKLHDLRLEEISSDIKEVCLILDLSSKVSSLYHACLLEGPIEGEV